MHVYSTLECAIILLYCCSVAGLTLGTAHWNTKADMGELVELVEVTLIAIMLGFIGSGLRRKLNTIFRPFFSNAVMPGISPGGICTVTITQY